MTDGFTFSIATIRFDEDYAPAATSRITTNFANLARGERRRENLRGALALIDARFDDLAQRIGVDPHRFTVELDIVSVELHFTEDDDARAFPVFEVLDIALVDRVTGERQHGIVGNNFSSYLRDYDFSVRLPAANEGGGAFVLPDDFGVLHGKLFEHFLDSAAYRERFPQPPVVCISVSTSRTYHRTGVVHPVLGIEYAQDGDASLTDRYFGRMGLQVRYFMPAGGAAPLAFYFRGDLLGDYSDLQLIGTIATMETFQRIYRPEIYGAVAPAASTYRPTLDGQDFVRTAIAYDRDERSRLAITQARYTEEHFVTPHRDLLDRWAAEQPAPASVAAFAR